MLNDNTCQYNPYETIAPVQYAIPVIFWLPSFHQEAPIRQEINLNGSRTDFKPKQQF